MTATRTTRRGSVLVLVLVFLAVLLVLGLGQSRLTSGVALEARRAAAYDAARAAARAALETAHHHLCCALNDPTSDATMYQALRTRLEGFSVAIPVLDLPAMAELLAEYPGLTVEDGAVRCDVAPQLPASSVNPTHYDRHGALRLTVAVVHESLGVVCRLAESYELRVNLTATPRPLDLTTFFLGDTEGLLSVGALGGDPNATIDAAVGRLAALRDTATNLRTNFEQLRVTLASIQDPRAQAPLAAVVQALSLVDGLLAAMPAPVTLVGGVVPSGPGTVCHFPPQPFALCSMAPAVPLPALDLPSRIGSALSYLATVEPTCEQALTNLQSLFTVRAPDLTRLPELTQAWTGAALESASCWAGVAGEYGRLQEGCLIIDGGPYQDLLPFLRAVDPDDLRRLASVFVAADGVTPVAAALDGLLARGEALNGVVYVDNPDEPLVVDRTFTGQTVLVVRGDCTITRAVVDDPSRDRLTLVTFGRTLVDGPVQGSVVAWGSFEGSESMHLEGNLVLATLALDLLSSDRILAGTVQRGATIEAGPQVADRTVTTVDVTKQTATLSPYPVLAEAARR